MFWSKASMNDLMLSFCASVASKRGADVVNALAAVDVCDDSAPRRLIA